MSATVFAPKANRGAVPICCANCGAVDFSRAPDLEKVYQFLVKHRRATTAEVSEGTGMSIAASSEKLRRLTIKLGLLRVVKTENAAGGGKINTYALAGRGA